MHVNQHGTTIYYRDETPLDDDYDRQLVRCLPD